jgi:hypothetical protein
MFSETSPPAIAGGNGEYALEYYKIFIYNTLRELTLLQSSHNLPNFSSGAHLSYPSPLKEVRRGLVEKRKLAVMPVFFSRLRGWVTRGRHRTGGGPGRSGTGDAAIIRTQ